MILVEGDEVALIAPASQLRGADVGLHHRAVDLLKSWGLRVRDLVPNTSAFYLAGSDQQRAEAVNKALTDDRIRAVFCLRGGYGSPRILRLLDQRLDVPNKLLVGYSDMTALQMAVQTRWPNIELVYGPNVATKQLLDRGSDARQTRSALHRTLFEPPAPRSHHLTFVCSGSAGGALTGGCLTMVSGLVGTGFLPDPRGKIVLLEDTSEPPYRIDRMLTQLLNAGFFAGVRGVVFGRMPRCEDGMNDLAAVVADLLEPLGIPIALGLPTGHGDLNLALRLEHDASMNSSEATVTVTA